MNPAKYLLLILVSISVFVNAQTFTDQIILKSGDTITCEITLINELNIFYTYKKKRTEKYDYVALNDVSTYNWLSKDIVPEVKPKRILFLYDSTNKWKIGLKITQHYDYPIAHTVPALSIYKRNHNFSIGPEYTVLLDDNFGDPVDHWGKEYWGLYIGYRYIINSKWKNTNLFLQTNFSFYKTKYESYQLGTAKWTNHTTFIIDNTIGLGISYKLFRHFELSGGIGFGSTAPFFLMIGHFIPHSFLGIEYKFN